MPPEHEYANNRWRAIVNRVHKQLVPMVLNQKGFEDMIAAAEEWTASIVDLTYVLNTYSFTHSHSHVYLLTYLLT